MPELPEVETIRLQLNQTLKGLKVVNIDVLSPKNFFGNEKELIGRKIVEVNRRAKVILFKLDNNNYLACHLKMTGQLIYKKARESGPCKINCGRYDVENLPNKYTRVIITFDNDSNLYFNDLRKFGWMKVLNSENDKLGIDKMIGQKYGLEPFDKDFSENYLRDIFKKTSKPIKLVLLDQEKIAGIGNIYASEILFSAGILPTKPAKKLSEKEIKKLKEAIIDTLTKAIKEKGTSDKDEAYRQINGDKGQYQKQLSVYNRAGKKCFGCNSVIKKIKLGGRGTYYCSKCQK